MVLDALAALGPGYKGCANALVFEARGDAYIEKLHAAGVRGARFSFRQALGAVLSRPAFDRAVARIRLDGQTEEEARVEVQEQKLQELGYTREQLVAAFREALMPYDETGPQLQQRRLHQARLATLTRREREVLRGLIAAHA